MHRQPRPVGGILAEMLQHSSNSPLAKGYRSHLASEEHGTEKGGTA